MIPHTVPALWPEEIHAAKFASRIRTESPEGCRVALLGLADDTGVRMNNGRPGAEDGPRAFREAIAKFGVADPPGTDWPGLYDAGDITSGADIHETHARVTEAVQRILKLGLIPVGIGGGHDLTYAFVRGVSKKFGKLAGAYADAHLDVRDSVGSGMPFRSLMEDCGAGPLWVHGLLQPVNAREHHDYYAAKGGLIVGSDPMAPAEKRPQAVFGKRPQRGNGTGAHTDHSPAWYEAVLTPLITNAESERDMFVSFDMDVVDAAYAPGVSAMNPCGWTPRFAETFAFAAGANPRVRCFDIMELNPAHDEGGRTARLAAYVFLAFLRGLSGRKP